ncbi:MAG: hypothetical protein LBC49_02480 [Bacteroidales bacterium]|jgi:hypothetical protein|nr:hypothetical protein [Bacteroidales bacterium]
MTTAEKSEKYNEMPDEIYSVSEPEIAKRHISSKEKLYELLEEGLEDVRQGRVVPWKEFKKELREM